MCGNTIIRLSPAIHHSPLALPSNSKSFFYLLRHWFIRPKKSRTIVTQTPSHVHHLFSASSRLSGFADANLKSTIHAESSSTPGHLHAHRFITAKQSKRWPPMMQMGGARLCLHKSSSTSSKPRIFKGTAHARYVSQHATSKANTNAIPQLSKSLVENGAEEITRTATVDPLPLQDITHIISNSTDFPEYEAASDALKSVVRPDWVKASIAKGRLANPRQYSPDPRLFFSGLVVCCADLPSGDSDAIIGGVLAMGGLYSSPVSKMVTHIVALTMDSDKCKTAVSRNVKCKYVLPHW